MPTLHDIVDDSAGEKSALLRGLVDAGLATIMDAECVDMVEDYEPVLRDIDQLTRGALRLSGFAATEGPKRTLQFRTAAGSTSFDVEERVVRSYQQGELG